MRHPRTLPQMIVGQPGARKPAVNSNPWFAPRAWKKLNRQGRQERQENPRIDFGGFSLGISLAFSAFFAFLAVQWPGVVNCAL
jgi:hypothetical protein